VADDHSFHVDPELRKLIERSEKILERSREVVRIANELSARVRPFIDEFEQQWRRRGRE
jgi:Holliday junction resolvasome RuvABC ATP-dependent DNA helicase subunit